MLFVRWKNPSIDGWTSEVGLQEQASNHFAGAVVKSNGAERAKKRFCLTGLGVSTGDEHKWTVDEVSRRQNILSKVIVSSMIIKSVAITCLLATRQAI